MVQKDQGSAADRIADSVLVLLIMTLLQRSIGFLRGIFFCRWLAPAELGYWDMAWGFIELAAPVAMLGIPGTFGRYVEHYRSQDQLRPFLRRTTAATAMIASLCVVLLALNSRWFSYVIFGTPDRGPLVLLLSVGLVAVIAYNFLTTLLTALRRSRVVSVLDFGNSILFATCTLALLAYWRNDSTSLILGYSVACVVTAASALLWLRPVWRSLPESRETALTHYHLWSKLLPFAVWVWGTNWLANLFELADRYMIVHWGGFEPVQAMVEVGNYHSSRVVPLLLVSVAGMLATIMTPYLSHDWETGGSRLVSWRMNFMLKVLGLAMLAGAIAVLTLAPLLFELGFKGKFAGGLKVLPLTLTYCLWFGMARVAQKYLWCAEHVRLAVVSWVVGLIVNVVLNMLLLPRYGLIGVVLSTAAGNLVSLIAMYCFNMRHGMRVDVSTWIVSFTPVVLVFGPWAAAILLMAALAAAVWTNVLLDASEKQQIASVGADYVGRLRAWMGRGNETVLNGVS